MLPRFKYLKAENLPHAVELLGQQAGRAKLLAGGTDLIVDMRERRQTPQALIDISMVRELQAVALDDRSVQIGAGVTIAELLAHPAVKAELQALWEACIWFADLLTRNKATIGGNIANASPGADLVVPLLALEASVILVSKGGERTLALHDFLQGPRRTAMKPGELLTEVVVPRRMIPGQRYEKLGLKHGGAIAVVSVATLMAAEDGRCGRVRIALGAVAPKPFRAREAERALEGQFFSPDLAGRAADLAAEASSPITDVRGSAEYRRAMVKVLVRRGLLGAWQQARGWH